MSNNKKTELTFWEHLMELLHRLRTIFYAIVVSTIFVMVFPINVDIARLSLYNPWFQTISSFLIRKLQRDFLPAGIELLPISWLAPLEVYIYVSIILGIMISSPVILYEVYKFIQPALYRHERGFVFWFITSFTSLFVFGFILGYLLIVPVTMRTMLAFANMLNLPPKYGFSEFFSLIMGTLLISSLIFTFPIYIVLLVKAGFVTTEGIKKNRKYIYAGSIILISILDPEPGIITEAALFVPIFILMEASILIARHFETSPSTSKSNYVS